METQLEITEFHLVRLLRKLAEEEDWRGRFAWLDHEIEECNLLEENKEAWQAWIQELLEGSEELRKAIQEEVNARTLLDEKFRYTSAVLKLVLRNRGLPRLENSPPEVEYPLTELN